MEHLSKEEKFRISVLKLWVHTLRVFMWIILGILQSNEVERMKNLNTANAHIRNADDQVEWYLS